ncbi:MAG TPA: TonB-dependent receptor [Rhizomicrobium sp.]|nr:TonB-dependent receptor [Rhizomicrobium sp.]
MSMQNSRAAIAAVGWNLSHAGGLFAVVLAAFVSLSSGDALAQASSQSGGLETVVVTAEKREERARDVPATITAVTADELTAVGPILGTGDLLQSVAGVRFNNLASNNLSEISIRGSGTERATGADSGVGLFVNGAYVGSSTLGGRNFHSLDQFDLARIEVLEGPQGALYGRNAEYGVVNIVLAQPEFNDSGSVTNNFIGGLDQDQAQAVINQQISDDVAVRFSGEAIGQSKGFYFNPDHGSYYDQTNGWIMRGQVRYKSGPLDVDLLVDGQDLQLPSFVNDYDAPPGGFATLPLGYTQPNRFILPENGQDGVHQSVQRAMLLANYDLGWGTLTSTTMATSWNSTQHFSAAWDLATEAQLQSQKEIGAYPLSQTVTNVSDRTFYQDLRLNGSALDNRLLWLVGGEVLAQSDHSETTVATSPCTLTATSGVCGGTPTTPICYELLSTSLACPKTFPLAFGTDSIVPQNYLSEAAYGSLTYNVTNAFKLAGDVRYTNDHKSAVQTLHSLYTTTLTQPVSSHAFTAGVPSYTMTASYMLPGAWQDLLYAKYGTGYRAGGVNNGFAVTGAPGAPFQAVYGDETTASYEAGVKGNLTSFVFFTLDAYWSRTGNAIASVNDGCTILNVCGRAQQIFNINGGTVHGKGVEASLVTKFDLWGGSLALSANGADQGATYVNVPITYTGAPLLNSSVAQIPHWTASSNLDYSHAVTSDIDVFLHASYQGQWGGGQDTVTGLAPLIPLDQINNVSLRVGMDYKKFQFAVFAQNLTNETVQLLKFWTNGVPLARRFNEPRTIGASLSYKW